VGGAETLRDEGVVFAERARQAGVSATLQVYPEMVHVFQMLPSKLVAGHAARAYAAIGAFVAAQIPGPAVPAGPAAADEPLRARL
jgi:epsilon-lactone hydrolase